MSVDRELDDVAECPACGDLRLVVSVEEGPPSMLGYGFDPDVLDLDCGHQVSYSPLDGTASVRPIPDEVASDRDESEACERGTPGCSVRHRSDSECAPW